MKWGIVEQTTKCGVYKFEHPASRRVYVGSSINIAHRRCDHLKLLRSGKHYNRHLQNTWSKYGESTFTFEILEECPPEQRRIREQHWINEYSQQRYRLFNVLPVVIAGTGRVSGRELVADHTRRGLIATEARKTTLTLRNPVEYNTELDILIQRKLFPEDTLILNVTYQYGQANVVIGKSACTTPQTLDKTSWIHPDTPIRSKGGVVVGGPDAGKKIGMLAPYSHPIQGWQFVPILIEHLRLLSERPDIIYRLGDNLPKALCEALTLTVPYDTISEMKGVVSNEL